MSTRARFLPAAYCGATVPGAQLQRACVYGQVPAHCERKECSQKRGATLQRTTADTTPVNQVPPIVREVLRAPGQPLGSATRALMEPRFGHDFSQVRVHTDAKAAESAHVIKALAFTAGPHVVFGAGQYQPSTASGQRLLAHELAHVLQQHTVEPIPDSCVVLGRDDDVAEGEAEVAASNTNSLSTVLSSATVRTGALVVQRQSLWTQIAGLFRDDDFSAQVLETYVDTLEQTDRIEGDTDSDNKARSVVRAWLRDGSAFQLRPRIKVLLIQEMQSGYTGNDDERAILDLLENSNEADLGVMFATGGLRVDDLLSDFQGLERRRLLGFFGQRFEGGLQAMRRGQVQPRARGSPYDDMAVERARRRLRILRRFVDEWSGREARRTSTAHERDPLLELRNRMDIDEEARRRAEQEQHRVPAINRRALTIQVTEEAVIFRVRFHVRFEDPAMETRFGELRDTLSRGLRETWNQSLMGSAFLGREFRVEAELTRISANQARNQDFWLITVRPDNRSQVNYPGCTFERVLEGQPTSATDPTCDGGVMSIPPAHITNSEVLGHELLHLFGLLDRYVVVEERPAPDRPPTSTRLVSMRETGDRPDPLGAERGQILREDLVFLFDRLDVYGMEERRGLEFLHRAERTGMTINSVIAEIHRLEEIIRLGRDPNSLIRLREDFTDRMLRQAEDF